MKIIHEANLYIFKKTAKTLQVQTHLKQTCCALEKAISW